MYNNINFPEGTNAVLAYRTYLDNFDKDYVFNSDTLDCDVSNFINFAAILLQKPLRTEKIKILLRYGSNSDNSTYYPELNLSSCTEISNMGVGAYTYLVFEGTFENLTKGTGNNIRATAIVNYPTGQPIVNLSNIFPNNKIIPYGDVPVKLRVLKDGAWMDGSESILYDGVEMNYKGGGLYEITKTVLPRKRFNFPITIGEYFFKSPDVSDSESIIYLGDNSENVHTIEGADILNLATDNSNGWFYDEANNGITNNDIGNNQSTTLTLSIPSLTIDIVYGQSSEKKYDFMTVLDADGKLLFTAKDIDGTDKTATINNTSNTYVFKYSKDASSDNGSDSCWINSITYTQLPDYPTN